MHYCLDRKTTGEPCNHQAAVAKKYNYKEQEPEEIHKFCMEVRKTVVDTLKSILGLHEHTRKAKFQLGFYYHAGHLQG